MRINKQIYLQVFEYISTKISVIVIIQTKFIVFTTEITKRKMFKLSFALLIVTLSLLSYVSGVEECCPTKSITFNTRDKSCSEFDAEKRIFSGCKIDVCNDGKKLTDGSYCGRGRCNFVGCECLGGCIKGDAIENFKVLHGDSVYDVDNDKLFDLF